MAFDDTLAHRIRTLLATQPAAVREQPMFGGLSFMLNEGFAIGIQNDELVVRLSPEAAAEALTLDGVRPMDFTGRPLKGWVYVAAHAIRTDVQLAHWVDAGVSRALAEPSRKRSRKGSQAAAVYPRTSPGARRPRPR